MAPPRKTHRDDFVHWFKTFLRDRGLQLSLCGFKGGNDLGKHKLDFKSGFWADPNYSASKPLRWLYHIESTDGHLEAVTPKNAPTNIGAINSAQADKAAVLFRLKPLIRQQDKPYHHQRDLELNVLIVFPGPTPRGSSSEPFEFNPQNGSLRFMNEAHPYLSMYLLGIQPRDKKLRIHLPHHSSPLTYGDVFDTVATAIMTKTIGGARQQIPTFDLTRLSDLNALKHAIQNDYKKTSSSLYVPPSQTQPATIFENTELIGIDPAVYRQINAALRSGKKHIMLYGPPGTGKTTLARHIAASIAEDSWTLITGSSDWTSQDIIGGYQPVGSGAIEFIPGVLLRQFDCPLIIDELNRCDIDKVIGPLFTVLAGQQTTLPYRVKIEDKHSQPYVILPNAKDHPAEHEFAPGRLWCLIATINSIDKAALYQMSYALSRRFGWVYVDAPQDTSEFISRFLQSRDTQWAKPSKEAICPLGEFWAAVNKVRTLGPALVIDAIKVIQQIVPVPDFFGNPNHKMADAFLDAIDMVILPMLDGITFTESEQLGREAAQHFNLDANQKERLKIRMDSVAV